MGDGLILRQGRTNLFESIGAEVVVLQIQLLYSCRVREAVHQLEEVRPFKRKAYAVHIQLG